MINWKYLEDTHVYHEHKDSDKRTVCIRPKENPENITVQMIGDFNVFEMEQILSTLKSLQPSGLTFKPS